jgi:hypothetical protein
MSFKICGSGVCYNLGNISRNSAHQIKTISECVQRNPLAIHAMDIAFYQYRT